MPAIQEIDVVIGRDGKVAFEVRGVTGAGCEDLTKDLETILGGRVVSREYKPSYHQQATQEDQTTSLRE